MTTEQTILETRLASLAGQQVRLQMQLAEGYLRGYEYLALMTPVINRITQLDRVGNTYRGIYQKVRETVWVQKD